jgi:MFS family permease
MMLTLFQAEQWPYILFVTALLNGTYISLFWVSFQTILSRNALKSNLGEDLGLIQIGMQLTNMLGPAFGGVVIVTMGYQVVFALALVLCIVSMIVSLLIKPVKLTVDLSMAALRTLLQSTDFSYQGISFTGRYLNDAVVLLWPLYIFLFLGAVDKVGYLYSLSFLLAMLLSLVFGVYIDHTKSKRSFMSSGGILSLLWFVRGWVFSIWGFALVDAVEKLVANFHWLFYDALMYRSSKSTEPVLYFMAREAVISCCAVVFWSSFILLFVYTADGWWSLFVLAAVGTLLSVLSSDTLHKYGRTS